jgi:hypothetical protein
MTVKYLQPNPLLRAPPTAKNAASQHQLYTKKIQSIWLVMNATHIQWRAMQALTGTWHQARVDFEG